MGKLSALGISILITSVLISTSFAVLSTEKTVHGSGSIKGVGLGIYADQQCQIEAAAIPFGVLEPGSNKDFTLYLRNEGNTDLTLYMTTQNWIPIEATEHMTVTWNREGYQISQDQVISFVITLNVSPNIQDIDTFDLDISIHGNG